jgi:hypothetical protein
MSEAIFALPKRLSASGSSASPETSCPRDLRRRANHEPLKPVCPVIR